MRCIIVLVLLSLIACAPNDKLVYEIDIHNASGDRLGDAKFTEVPEGVNIHVKLKGLTAGYHGIHIHEEAKCEGPDFISAGEHLNPDDKSHGLMHPEGNHLGDLPNIEADGEGKVDVELLLRDATLKEGRYSLLQEDGTSLVIHEKADDGITQPSGDSGERIACGVLKKDDS